MRRHSLWLGQLLFLFFTPEALPSPASQDCAICYVEQERFEFDFPVHSVAIDNETMVLGSYGLAHDGRAFVYVRTGTTWALQAELVPHDGSSEGAQFGYSVGLSGDTVVVGAPRADGVGTWYPSGVIEVFVRSGNTWWYDTSLVGSATGDDHYFGISVAISGDTIAVGADWGGDAFVLERGPAGWSETSSFLGEYVGGRIALGETPTGTTLLFNAAGGIRVYQKSGSSWILRDLIDRNGTPAISGDSILVGDALADLGGSQPGKAWVYRHDGIEWGLEQQLVAPDVGDGDRFGRAVAIEGDLAIVGAPGSSGSAHPEGLAHVFSRQGASWSVHAPITPPSIPAVDIFEFGGNIAISDATVVAGAKSSSFPLKPYEGGIYDPKRATGVAYCTCGSPHCGNRDPRAGCANSTGEGATLTAQGIPANADVDLLVSNAIPNQFGLFFQADNAIQAPFGDGFLCTYGNLIRLMQVPIQTDPLGAARFGPCFGDATIPELTGVVPGSGETKRYQIWYRDPAGPGGTGANTTNALAIAW